MNKKFFIRVIFILVFCCLGIYILLNFKSKFIIKNGVLVRYKEGIFAKLTNPKQITIPDEVTRIGECAFRRCFEVETITITIPDSVEVIELAAFSYCENLKEVYLPSKLRYIPMFCFGECRKLEKAYMQDNIKMIDIFAFTECTSLEYIDFPSSIIIINEFVFSYTGLKSVKLPEKLEHLGGECFLSSANLKSVEFPRTIKYIGAEGYVFEQCKSLETITLPEGFSLGLKYDKKVNIKYYK